MLSEVNATSQQAFFDLVTLTLTYKLDLDILPLDLHAKIQVCMSARSAMRVVTHAHRHTHDVKTITPIMSETWGVKSIYMSPFLY